MSQDPVEPDDQAVQLTWHEVVIGAITVVATAIAVFVTVIFTIMTGKLLGRK